MDTHVENVIVAKPRKKRAGMLSMSEIASKTGVSIATVSRILNNSPKVTDDTRRKVLNVVNRAQSVSHPNIRRKHYNIGISFADFSADVLHDEYNREIILGMMEVCYNQDCRVQITDILLRKRRAQTFTEVFMDLELDAVVHIAPLTRHSEVIEELADAGFKQFAIGTRINNLRVGWIDSENVASSRQVIRYLISLGHKKIGVVSGPIDMFDHKERVDGYLMALQDAELESSPSLQMIRQRARPIDLESCTLQLLVSRPDITAVYYTNSNLAIGGMKAIKKLGLRIPQDISIITYADSINMDMLTPRLTYLLQPAYEMGQYAGQQIIASLQNSGMAMHNKTAIPEFFIRESVGPAKRVDQIQKESNAVPN